MNSSSVLPINSKWELADNPHIFSLWLDEENPNKLPYIALCQDQMRNSSTWHILCDEEPFHEIVYKNRSVVDKLISNSWSNFMQGFFNATLHIDFIITGSSRRLKELESKLALSCIESRPLPDTNHPTHDNIDQYTDEFIKTWLK